jgi:hypothetical protein
MLTPADGDSVYSVGSVDGSGLWGGSGYGPTYDGTVKPDGMAMGKGTSLIGDNCSVGAANGSSFASPIMCGAIACLWQALPHLKNWQLRNLVRMSSDRYTNPNNTHGFGIPNFCTAYQIALGTSDVQSIDYTFSLYPNPSQGEFYIKSYDPSITEFAVTIYDITGRLIYKSSKMVQTNYYVDALKNVPAGDYVVLISTVNKQYSSKITKR